jgi:hypothetical protein
VTTQGTYSHGLIIVPFSFKLKKYIVVKPNVEIHVHLITGTPSYNIITFNPIPPVPCGDPSQPIGSTTITFAPLKNLVLIH